MSIAITEDCLLVTMVPDGPLESELAESLEAAVTAAIDRDSTRFVLNLQKVPHARSTGLEAVIRIARKIADVDGRLAVVGANDVVGEILRATRLDRRLAVFDSTESAMHSMTSEE